MLFRVRLKLWRRFHTTALKHCAVVCLEATAKWYKVCPTVLWPSPLRRLKNNLDFRGQTCAVLNINISIKHDLPLGVGHCRIIFTIDNLWIEKSQPQVSFWQVQEEKKPYECFFFTRKNIIRLIFCSANLFHNQSQWWSNKMWVCTYILKLVMRGKSKKKKKRTWEH